MSQEQSTPPKILIAGVEGKPEPKPKPPKKLLKRKPWVPKKIKRLKSADVYLEKKEAGSIKIYNERLGVGLMIFPHSQIFNGQASEGFAVCPYEIIGGRIKWRAISLWSSDSDREDPGQREWKHYDKIHIDRADIVKFVRALAYIAGLVKEGPGEKLQPPKKPELSEIEKRIMKFRL